MAALLLAQTDTTGRTVTLIVLALVSVAAALALLTAWYWRVTDPVKRGQGTQGRRGRGGRRKPANPDPAPDGAAEPRIRVNSTPAEAADYAEETTVPGADEPPLSDATRVMHRSEILDHVVATPPAAQTTTPAPQVIDLRTPARSESEPSAIDLTQEERAAADVDEPDSNRVQASAGAHDSGLSFDDWLALAEEDK